MSSHDPWTDRLSDYADDELPAGEKAAVDEHLAGCAGCREVLAELRSVVARARSLADAPPDRDLWPGVSARLEATPQTRVLPMRATRRFSFTLPQLVAAGLALMVLSGGMVWLARLGGDRTDFPLMSADTSGALPASFADTRYDDAIVDLQQTLEEDRARLDPDTVRVIEQNLAAIDDAIEQSRRALATDPANAYLSDHLVAAKKRKLVLLRRAMAMMAMPGSAGG